uniref:PDZ domain-containing protein n=1 Tax=Noctiluca scintillans TaxID=2966 RepID=A0A7S1AKB9_NOCSC|mmetsp:Transcript_49914/g.132659  ORF Transcript_49914/g.132659 Transcript_49914/m.132659 type:complete len:177 (+) Transcript_49914:81-611(+)
MPLGTWGNECCCVASVVNRAVIIGVDDTGSEASESTGTGGCVSTDGPMSLPDLMSEVTDSVDSTPEPFDEMFFSDLQVFVGREFTVTLRRQPDDFLGAKVLESLKSCDVTLKSVGMGPLRDWNEERPHLCVSPGDKVVSVNGVRGPTAAAMIQKLKTEEELELVILRCSGCAEVTL